MPSNGLKVDWDEIPKCGKSGIPVSSFTDSSASSSLLRAKIVDIARRVCCRGKRTNDSVNDVKKAAQRSTRILNTFLMVNPLYDVQKWLKIAMGCEAVFPSLLVVEEKISTPVVCSIGWNEEFGDAEEVWRR